MSIGILVARFPHKVLREYKQVTNGPLYSKSVLDTAMKQDLAVAGTSEGRRCFTASIMGRFVRMWQKSSPIPVSLLDL